MHFQVFIFKVLINFIKMIEEDLKLEKEGQLMSDIQKNNPLHGITLESIVTDLVSHYGWEKLGNLITIRCFQSDPSVKSSLKFLRKTPWARKKVEDLYLKLPR
ncbi:MAG: VF530 family protein [Bacteriovoracaceae bacterium]|nr:VF530 family protein [Bacteriovoracaceae bacterium]